MTKPPMVQGSTKWKTVGSTSLQSNEHTQVCPPHPAKRGHISFPAPNGCSSWVLCTDIPQHPIPPAAEGT